MPLTRSDLRLTAVLLAGLLTGLGVCGQTRQHIDYFSVGGFAGVSHYNGDLSPGSGPTFPQGQLAGIAQVGPAFGLFGSYHWHPHMSVRLYVGYGHISADDAKSENPVNRTRNLSFASNLWEVSAQLYYDYFGNLRDYRFRPQLTPFVFAGVGFVAYDPYAYRDVAGRTGQTFLRPLRTEGQEVPYGSIAFVLPCGGGLRYRLNDHWDLRLEVGLRWTATDYLDDVSGATPGRNQGHPTPDQLAGSPDRLLFAYRATGVTNYNLRRGNPAKTDWYAFTGLSLAYILDNPAPCPKPQRRGRLRD